MFVLLTAVLALSLVSAPAHPADAEEAQADATPTSTLRTSDLETTAVEDLRALLDEGQISAVQVARVYLERIAQTNARYPALNSVRAINPNWLQEAREADQRRAAGDDAPLLGVPVLVKDNTDVAGMPTTAGSLALADNYPVADAPHVAAMKEAGAVIIGKTNLTEFSHYLSQGQAGGYSSLGGQVLNAYDLTQGPGSSSAGSGVAVAVGQTPLATGTETCCSIIGPATSSSVVGIKTTKGLISRTGIVPISMHMDVPGPMAGTVHDAALQLGAMTTGYDPADPVTAAGDDYVDVDYTEALQTDALDGARLGVFVSSEPSGDQAALWQDALDTLEARGATLVEVDFETARPTTWPYDFARDLNMYLETRTADDYPLKSIGAVADFYRANPRTTQKYGASNLFNSEQIDVEAEAAQNELDRAGDLEASQDVLDAAMSDNDLDAMVTTGSSLAQMATTSGYPTVGVPAGYQPSNGRPFGISFTAEAFSEEKLIGYAYSYEQASQLRRPPSEMNPAAYRCVGLDGQEAAAASCPPADQVSLPGCEPDELGELPFSDVHEGNVHAHAVACLASLNITSGVADGSFGPALSVSRAQTASFLDRALGVVGRPLPPAGQSFTDVGEGSVHADAIGRLAGIGVIEGLDESTFGPNRTITREQLSSMLVRTLEWAQGEDLASSTSANFADRSEISSAHLHNVDIAVDHGLVQGREDGTFAPRGDARRDQTASMIYRFTLIL